MAAETSAACVSQGDEGMAAKRRCGVDPAAAGRTLMDYLRCCVKGEAFPAGRPRPSYRRHER